MVLNVVGSSPTSHPKEVLDNRKIIEDFSFCRQTERIQREDLKEYCIYGGSRNLVGIAIQLSDSEEEKLFVHDSMQVSPE